MLASDIAKELGGRRAGKGWSCRCPNLRAHKRGDPALSLSVRDGDYGRPTFWCSVASCDSRDLHSVLRERGLVEDPPPAPPTQILCEEIAENLALAAMHAQLGIGHAEAGDTLGVAYAVRRLVAYVRFAAATTGDLIEQSPNPKGRVSRQWLTEEAPR